MLHFQKKTKIKEITNNLQKLFEINTLINEINTKALHGGTRTVL